MGSVAKVSGRIISRAELAAHTSEADCWISIDGIVYDVSKFLKVHPGGKSIIMEIAGRDATEEFFSYHRKDVLAKYGDKLRVGQIEGSVPLPVSLAHEFDTYTPFAESSAVRGWFNPYMSESHRHFRLECRRILAKHVYPHVEEMHERGTDPSEEMYLELGKAGLLAARCGPYTMPFVKQLGISLPGNVSTEDFDYFHEMIALMEFYRTGSGGVSDGLGAGLTIGLPPIIMFGRRKFKERIVPEIVLGRVRACLAITEPVTGSDVASITTTAKLSDDGSHYIVNGMKKWITTSGTAFPTVYTTAVRTGGPGHTGISLLVIEDPKTPQDGTITKHRIKTSYSAAAGTALLIFDNVRVPKENLLGPEGQGFKMIMANFNHERWFICVICSAFARTCVSECFRWAIQRKAFGKRLVDQPVIRYKLAEMAAVAECMDAWLETLTYQMTQMTPMEEFENLSAPIALCKFLSTRHGVMLADHACQIFGGRGVTRTGMGRQIEAFKNEFKFASILGGSEEIVADLAVRQAVAHTDKLVKKSAQARMQARL